MWHLREKWEKMGWDGVLFFSQTNKKENAIKVETTRERSRFCARAHAKREKGREEEGERRQSRSRALEVYYIV